MPKDLRGFIKELAATMPEQIHSVTDQVDPRFGVTAIAARLAKEGKFPALFFTNLKGSSLPLLRGFDPKIVKP